MNSDTQPGPTGPDSALNKDELSQEQNQEREEHPFWIYWDMGIIALVVINLLLILFDSMFAVSFVNDFLESALPSFHQFYSNQVHDQFLQIDLIFVSIFIIDVVIGWTAAVVQNRYHRWFFYPFVHWYDVLGCVPVAGFRWLRLLRVFALGWRLQRRKLIDVRQWAVFKTGLKYYEILMEEISDRVVVNVLTGIQDEMRQGGSKLPRRITREVIVPRQEQIVEAVAQRVTELIRGGYEDHRDELKTFIADIVEHSIDNNSAASQLEKVPWIGKSVVQSIDDTITESVTDVLDAAVGGLGESEYRALVAHITQSLVRSAEAAAEETDQSDDELEQVVLEIIDIIKDQVSQQRWKNRYN